MESIENKRLTRGSTWVAGGVCAGLANHFGLRKGGIQAVFVITSLFSGLGVIVYLLLWALLPKARQH